MRSIKIIALLLLSTVVKAQQLPDSTRVFLQTAASDSIRHHALMETYYYFEERNRDSALYYVEQDLLITRKNNIQLQVASGLDRKGYQLSGMGRYAEALPCFLEAFKIAEDRRNESNNWFAVVMTPEESRLLMLSLTHHMFAILMGYTQNTEQLIFHNTEAKRIGQQVRGFMGHQRVLLANMNLGAIYLQLNKLDSALFFLEQAKELALQVGQKKYLGFILLNFADASLAKGDTVKMKQFYDEAVQSAIEQDNVSSLARVYYRLSQYFINKKERDSSLFYALKMQEAIKILGPVISTDVNAGAAYEMLYRSYELRQQADSALKYANLSLVTRDNISKKRMASLAEFQTLSLREQQRLQELEKDKVIYQSRLRTYAMLAGLAFVLVIALILYRNNRQKQKSNIKIEQAYEDLKVTQRQLIQSEKMASLGELTAGIAHEIQNPLNFVNNFSEVNTELIDEMKEEIIKGNLDEARIIADSIKENEQKISHHGKRADSIVKGMLQHSRNSSGEKELADINNLVDECLRLSFHGMRAKDKSFNAKTVTDLGSLPPVRIISQDIGRVLLNLFTNSFYSVLQKRKQGIEGYEPVVSVSTATTGNGIRIVVKDNGMGIPQKALDKIFQPFFTTKPTGEGTGLGLSMSYDIITKGHGGKLTAETQEGEYALFTIEIPYKS